MDVVSSIIGGLGSVALAAVGIIVHGIRGDISALQEAHRKIEDDIRDLQHGLGEKIASLHAKVSILLDRDRRKRLSDYENENGV